MQSGPGCCCHSIGPLYSACACYRFDAKKIVDGSTYAPDQSNGLHLTSHDPNYVSGKLLYASQHTGYNYHEHGSHDCFMPKESGKEKWGSTGGRFGLNIWFWIKRVKPPGSVSSPPNKIEYVISKGEWANTNLGYFEPPNSDAGGFSGTWSIFIDPTVSDSGSFHDIHFAVAYEDGHTDTLCEEDSWEDPTAWVFFFWWYEPTAGLAGAHTGRYSLVRNGVTVFDEQTVAIGDAANPMEDHCREDLIVGKNLGTHLSETILIDNLGFSRRMGTKEQMMVRHNDLYAAGVGKECR